MLKIIGLVRCAAFVLMLGSYAEASSTKDFDREAYVAVRTYAVHDTVAKRKKLAEVFLDYWVSFDTLIPRNTPEDTKWVKDEWASGDINRRLVVLKSKQYALDYLSKLST